LGLGKHRYAVMVLIIGAIISMINVKLLTEGIVQFSNFFEELAWSLGIPILAYFVAWILLGRKDQQ